MKNPTEIKALAYARLEESEILCNAGKYDGAFYLAGYSIELILKAKICENFGIDNLFDESLQNSQLPNGIGGVRKAVKTHDIWQLLIFCGLAKKAQTAASSTNDLLWKKTYGYLIAGTPRNTNMSTNMSWSEQVRYLPIGSQREHYVKDFITLLKGNQGLLKWIENN